MDPKVEQIFQEAESRANGLAILRTYKAAMQGQPWALCFWLKCRAGWRERPVDTESTGVRERREEQDSFVRSKISDPAVQRAANALLATLNDPSVRVDAPVDGK
jgi:hypothetical protein